MRSTIRPWTPRAVAVPAQRPVARVDEQASRAAGVLRFTVGRFSDNELILFDEGARESWIVYPPSSAYAFLARRRSSAAIALVEHHPWAPFVVPMDHQLHPRDACLVHGAACPANEALQAAIDLGFNPFR
jgi:hypothetical protein